MHCRLYWCSRHLGFGVVSIGCVSSAPAARRRKGQEFLQPRADSLSTVYYAIIFILPKDTSYMMASGVLSEVCISSLLALLILDIDMMSPAIGSIKIAFITSRIPKPCIIKCSALLATYSHSLHYNFFPSCVWLKHAF